MLGVFKRILIHLGPQVRQGVQRGLKECRGRRRGGGGVGSRFVAVEIHKAVVFFTIEDVLIEILVVENVLEVVVVDKGVLNTALVEEETT